jgi:glycosyltransferase involved in cell wall biosynthesis
VDDGSTDGTRGVLERCAHPGVTVRFQENAGAHAAISRGIDETTAELVFILNSDDRFTPDRVRRFVALFEADPELAFAGSWLEVINEKGRSVATKKAWQNLEPWLLPKPGLTFQATDDPRGNLLQGNYLATTSNFVFRRSAWEKHRPFRALRYAHDWDFALRVACRDRIAVVPEPLVHYRVHSRNTIREDRLAMEFEVLWVMAANLADYLETWMQSEGGAASRQEYLNRALHSVQSFGRDRLLWLMVALAGSGERGRREFASLLDPANPVRQWLLESMR